MFIVPITLFSCAARGEAAAESTISRVSITVSMSAALHDPLEQRVLGPDAHVLRARQLAGRVLGADADDHLDVRVRARAPARAGRPSRSTGP